MISVVVEYQDKFGNPVTDTEIIRIFVASETDKAVILCAETETKYPVAGLYSGSGVMFATEKGNFASIKVSNLPFTNAVVIAHPGRYSLYLCLFQDVQDDARKIYPEIP